MRQRAGGAILLISDDPALSRRLQEALGAFGFAFLSEPPAEADPGAADDGMEHLVLVDASAAGMDVPEVMRRWRSEAARRARQVLVAGTIEIVPALRTVQVDGETLVLTSAEYNVLECLARGAGRVVTRDELSGAASGRRASPLDRSLDVHVSRLRRKLRRRGSQIVTVRGVGYMLAAG